MFRDASAVDLASASMSGLSANFIYLEEERVPLHTMKVFEMRIPPEATLSQMWAVAERVTRILPPLRWRAKRVAGDLHHPQWYQAHDFDVRDHVALERDTLGSESELDRAVGRLAGCGLDIERGAWTASIYRWRNDPGRIVVIVRIHHALADGLAVEHMLERVAQHWNADAEAPVVARRGPGMMLARAMEKRVRSLSLLPWLLVDSVRGWRDARRAREDVVRPAEVPTLFEAPTTSLDRVAGNERRFTYIEVPLATIHEIKEAFGCTVGDVVLNLAASGLREYFGSRGESPEGALVAGVPVALIQEDADHPRISGNNLSHMPVSLYTEIADEVLRLRAISAGTKAAKHVHSAFGSELLRAWSELSMRRVLRGMFAFTRRFRRPPINVVVSNVRGPQRALQWDGVTITRILSVGPVLDRIGLNMTAWSYRNHMSISLLANANNVDDLRPVIVGMTDCVEQLLRRARRFLTSERTSTASVQGELHS